MIVNDHMIVTLYVNIIFKQFTADWRCEVLHLCTICVSCVDITFILRQRSSGVLLIGDGLWALSSMKTNEQSSISTFLNKSSNEKRPAI